MVIPHPFGYFAGDNYGFYEKKSIFKKIHGIEVLNSTELLDRNRSAFYWAKNSGKAYVGGSDTHTRFGLGRAVTMTYSTKKVEEFLENIRKRKTGVVGKELPIRGRLGVAFSIWKNIPFFKKINFK